jgi:hypothetical protein
VFSGGNDLNFFRSCLQNMAINRVASWREVTSFDGLDGLAQMLDAFEDISGYIKIKVFLDYEVKAPYEVYFNHHTHIVFS